MPAARAQQRFSSADYRRSARRLRCIFHRQPGQLQRSLRQLADSIDHRREDLTQPARPLRSLRITRFEGIVRQTLSEGPLRYSRRIALLKAGEDLGIGRFEANLILAIEHNRIQSLEAETPSRPLIPAAAILIAGLVQSLLLAAACWIMQA